jgi:hypothetical protein
MNSFYITLPAQTRIYRSKDTDVQIYSGDWFSYTKEETIGYGRRVATFKTKRDLRLLNIASNQFYNDYVDRLNLHFKDYVNNDDLLIIKLKYLFPLGFNNVDYNDRKNTYEFLVRKLGWQINTPNNDEIVEHTTFYNGRSRYSDKTLDDEMSILLKQLYKEYDGFTSTINLPTVFQNGFFRKELVIFSFDNLELESIEDVQQSGGIINSNDESIHTKIIMPSNVSKEIIEEVFGSESNIILQKDIMKNNKNNDQKQSSIKRFTSSNYIENVINERIRRRRLEKNGGFVDPNEETIYNKIIMPSNMSKDKYEEVFGLESKLILQKDIVRANTVVQQKQGGDE